MSQNVTLRLNVGLLQKAKAFASRHRTSLSQLMVNALRQLLDRTEGYEHAQHRARALLKRGWPLGGGPYYDTRDDLHARHRR